MTLKEWLRAKALSFLGLGKYEGTPGDDRLTFINDEDHAVKQKIREYNVWYSGDSDELLNFYTRQNTIDYNYEPWFARNKRSYFWSVTSTENDIKRSHSGQPRNIVDTIVAIMGKPDVQGGHAELGRDNPVNKNIDNIIRENDFWNMYEQLQVPLTLVEGWGCFKLNWDRDLSDYPIIQYYRAEQVDFVIKSNRLIAVIFKDYYTDGKNKRYLLTETRRSEVVKTENNKLRRDLHIVLEAFEVTGEDDIVKPVSLKDVDQFAHLEEHVVIEGFNKLFAIPSRFYEDVHTNAFGRSIYTGKIDLFDDLDQCLSQAANTVRRSTVVEYFNSDFLERDVKTGLPIQPKEFDRKYVQYTGAKGADGGFLSADPVQVTQPDTNFAQYSEHAIQIMLQIINGIMSPATMGIDISKRDNAEAQREKEKITIFTRNMLIAAETRILQELFSQALCAYECMNTGKITVKEYDISVNYSAFADDSFENKIGTLGDAFTKRILSPKMYMSKLYGHTLSESDYNSELAYLEQAIKKDDEDPFEEEADQQKEEIEDLLGVNKDEEQEQEPFN